MQENQEVTETKEEIKIKPVIKADYDLDCILDQSKHPLRFALTLDKENGKYYHYPLNRVTRRVLNSNTIQKVMKNNNLTIKDGLIKPIIEKTEGESNEESN